MDFPHFLHRGSVTKRTFSLHSGQTYRIFPFTDIPDAPHVPSVSSSPFSLSKDGTISPQMGHTLGYNIPSSRSLPVIYFSSLHKTSASPYNTMQISFFIRNLSTAACTPKRERVLSENIIASTGAKNHPCPLSHTSRATILLQSPAAAHPARSTFSVPAHYQSFPETCVHYPQYTHTVSPLSPLYKAGSGS